MELLVRAHIKLATEPRAFRRHLQRGVLAVVLAVAGILDAVARPFSWTADASSAVLILAVTCLVWARLGRRYEPRGGDGAPGHGKVSWPTWATWCTLAAALAAVELSALFSSPRHDHPTLSSLASPLSTTTPGRLVAFTLLAAAGWWVAR